jgi:hypothetical protein
MKHLAALLALLTLAGCSHFARVTADEQLIRTHPERFVVITLQNTEPASLGRAGSSPRDYGSALQYMVAPGTRATAHELATFYKLKPVREWPITQLRIHCIVYRMDDGDSQSDLLRRLRVDTRVESAQPLNSFGTLSGGGYNDPYAGLQQSLPAMGVAQAHAWSRGKGVRIAVIDTAVDVNHSDLKGSTITVTNFTGQRPNAGAHGTAVAGVIAARGDNRLGIVGIAPDAHIDSLAACWPDPATPARAVCDSFTLAVALGNALDLKADIVNLSLGGPSDPLLTRLVQHGLARDMIFVGALPTGGVAKGFPSEIPGVLRIDAVGHKHTAQDVLLAPGTDVLTLVPKDGYDFVSGSSMAAANASGAIALLLSQHRKANQIRDVLAQTAPAGDSINICVALAGREAGQRCSPKSTPAFGMNP